MLKSFYKVGKYNQGLPKFNMTREAKKVFNKRREHYIFINGMPERKSSG